MMPGFRLHFVSSLMQNWYLCTGVYQQFTYHESGGYSWCSGLGSCLIHSGNFVSGSIPGTSKQAVASSCLEEKWIIKQLATAVKRQLANPSPKKQQLTTLIASHIPTTSQKTYLPEYRSWALIISNYRRGLPSGTGPAQFKQTVLTSLLCANAIVRNIVLQRL